jgi:hypothetical protein
MQVHLEVAVAGDWRPLEPGSGRMSGGTETLALRLASTLAAAGHGVTFRGGGWAGEHGGVQFLADGVAVPPADVGVCVNGPWPPDVAAERSVYWSHAAQLPTTGAWGAVVAVSHHHAGLLRRRLPDANIVAIPGGASVVGDGPSAPPRDRFLYCSSPDRGLHRLLRIWPALWRGFGRPLSVTYDFRSVVERRAGGENPLAARLREIIPLIDQPGVVVHPALSEESLHRLRARSLALLYPLDPVLADSELYALAVLDACAAGVPPVLSKRDCFPDEYAHVARFVKRFEPQDWVEAVGEVLDRRPEWAERARAHARGRSWAEWTERWLALLAGLPVAPRQADAPPANALTASSPATDRRHGPWRPPLLVP